jgi:hypothetical protein
MVLCLMTDHQRMIYIVGPHRKADVVAQFLSGDRTREKKFIDSKVHNSERHDSG